MGEVQWEIQDGERVLGPYPEQQVRESIGKGLPSSTRARRTGERAWAVIGEIEPFASVYRGAVEVEVEPEPEAPVGTWKPGEPIPGMPVAKKVYSPVRTVAAALFGALAVILIVAKCASGDSQLCEESLASVLRDNKDERWDALQREISMARTACKSEHTAEIDEAAARLAEHYAREAASAASAAAAEAPQIRSPPRTKETWATIPFPGKGAPDTEAYGTKYIEKVLSSAPGEPGLNKKMAMPLLERLRAEMVKTTNVPTHTVAVSLGDDSGTMIVDDGVFAHLSVGDEIRAYPFCSQAFLAVALLTKGIEPIDFAKAGMRGLVCKSNGCSAIFDMRPTGSGAGLYGGDHCLTMDDVLRMAITPQ